MRFFEIYEIFPEIFERYCPPVLTSQNGLYKGSYGRGGAGRETH